METASHPVTNGLEGLKVTEASGAAACGLNDAVDRFNGRRSNLIGIERQDPVPVSSYGSGEFFKRLQSAARRPGTPLLKVHLCTGRARPAPSLLKVFSQSERPTQRLVLGAEGNAQFAL